MCPHIPIYVNATALSGASKHWKNNFEIGNMSPSDKPAT